VETGDGRTEDSGGLTRNEENVIRLPRDWLGPPEELVPIGPAARARAAQREAEDGMPPAADAFWSEDSAALHDAVRAPSGAGHKRLEPPVGLVPPVAGLRVPGVNRLQGLGSLTGGRRVSRWWGLLALLSAALLVVAVIGSTEGPASHPPARNASASRPFAVAGSPSSSSVSSGNAARERFAAQLKTARGHARTRPRARARKTHPAHHRATARRPAKAPAITVTHEASATPTPQTSTQSAVPTTSTTPARSTASTIASTGSKPATEPAGPTRLGQMLGGCTPKCP
jgi:hypothetical protein